MIDRWLVNDVSWVSAVAYAQTHRNRVLGIVSMAVTTATQAEVDWTTEQVPSIYSRNMGPVRLVR